jgi:beta-xylosidase
VPRSAVSRLHRLATVGRGALLGPVVLLLLGLGPADGTGTASTAARPLPVLGASVEAHADDVGDPFVLPVPDGLPDDPAARYVLLWTTDWQSNVPAATSPDLVHWHRVADALPDLPVWATPSRAMTWAPAAQAVPGGWVLYYTTQERRSGRQCIGVATAAVATGPFRDRSSGPLICQRDAGGSIDPSVVREPSGRTSLVWKNDGNARGTATSIWQRELSADGRSLVGPTHLLLTATRPWQDGIIEGPAMLAAKKGGWWLFFSGGAWASGSYGTGVAWCRTLAGPCSEAADRPLLASAPGAVSPGGLETFLATDGRLWASFSTFPDTPPEGDAAMGENRVLRLAPVLSR